MNNLSSCSSEIRYLQVLSIDQNGIIHTLKWLTDQEFGSIGKDLNPGQNYLDHCRLLGPTGIKIAETIEEVLSRKISTCLLEFDEIVKGKNRQFELSINPLADHKGHLTIIVVDITDRNVVHSNLLRTTSQYKSAAIENQNILNFSLDIICIINAEGKFTTISDACEKILGYKSSELQGKPFIDFVHEDDKEKTIAEANKIMSGIATITFENRYQHKDGHLVDIMWSANWFEGTKTMFCVARDITDRKKNDSLLLKLNSELEIKTKGLQDSNTELERFAYVASHDLQEPLRMVSSFLELLERKYAEKLDEQAKKYIYFARDGAHRMKVLIEDLLDYARIGTEKRSFELLDTNKILQDILRIYEDPIKENNIQINVPLFPQIYGISTQIHQLFLNIISNSIKYKNNRNDQPVIDLFYKENDTHWIFAIKDNGMGIEAKFLNKVFVLFQRLHTKSEYSGTGIGLAISKKIAQRHGGEIWVESEINVGSTFFISILKTLR